MGKRKRGTPKSKRRREAMTRRDPGEKRKRRAERESEHPDDDAEDDYEALGEDEADAPFDDEDSEADDAGDGDDESGVSLDGDSLGGDAHDDAEDDDDEEPIGLPDGAPWALPLAKFERKWTWLETRLLFAALCALTVLLCYWFMVRGMKEPPTAKESAGTFFRMMLGAGVLGGLARLVTRIQKLEERKRNIVTVLSMVIGVLAAFVPAWRAFGVEYFSHVLDWLQEGSTLTLFGGLSGISTRLTMLVALLGASLAAASGTHIAIDVVVRFIPEKLRKPVNIGGALVTALVCVVASWGFFDFISVTSFGAKPGETPSAKAAHVTAELGEHFFLWRKQAGLDLGALPKVLMGKRWDSPERMNGREWNEFLEQGGFVERYGAEKVATIKASKEDLDSPRVPFVVVPDGNARGMLVHGLDLIFPLGFLMIGLRMLLRALLVFAGHQELTEYEPEDDEDEDTPPDPEPAQEAA